MHRVVFDLHGISDLAASSISRHQHINFCTPPTLKARKLRRSSSLKFASHFFVTQQTSLRIIQHKAIVMRFLHTSEGVHSLRDYKKSVHPWSPQVVRRGHRRGAACGASWRSRRSPELRVYGGQCGDGSGLRATCLQLASAVGAQAWHLLLSSLTRLFDRRTA